LEIYDYVIVGAGSAGCVVARRLSDNPAVRVLLIEAGPPAERFWIHTPAGMAKLFFDKHYNWNYFTEPMPELQGRKMYWPRGRGLGGSSAINGMVYIRGHRRDFDHWASLGNPGWGYEDVLPYFKRMEHNERGADTYRGVGGPLWISDPAVLHPSSADFIASAVRSGIPRTSDLNGACHDAVGYIQHNIRHGVRQSAYTAYVEPVRARSNLSILANAFVRRVVLEGTEATGVELEVDGGVRIVRASREIILSAGALNTPQLLMLSGVGPVNELQRHGIRPVIESPGVGRNLQDHFYIHCSFRSTPESSYNRNISGIRKYWEGLRYIATKKGYLALGSSQVAAFIKSCPDEPYADLQISFRPMTFNYHKGGTIAVDPVPAVAASVYRVRPSATGTVTLRSNDPHTAPVINPNFLTNETDVVAMMRGIRRIREIVAAEPLASRIVTEKLPGSSIQSDAQLLQFMETHGNSAFHPAGTCKMGQDRMAVVDERLCVRGTQRLRVVDASIMPRVTSGNTNAPSMMIGEKGADMITQDSVAQRPMRV
jgi:choline dehydrogenase